MFRRFIEWWNGKRPATPCPYCVNQDRNSVFDGLGCGWENPYPENGADAPCVCDSYPADWQMLKLGMAK